MVTRKTAYALRALCNLARTAGERSQLAADIAAKEGIPRRFLDSILRQLTRAGILTSSRGPRGGYALRAPANTINVAAVIRILDGAAFPFPCLNWDHPVRCAECPGPGACAAERALGAMGNVALQVLEDLTLAELVERMDRANGTAPTSATFPLRRDAAPPAREAP